MARSNKYSYEPIPNLDADWERDENNGNKPFSGESVQNFIKGKLREHDSKINGIELNGSGVAETPNASGNVMLTIPEVDSQMNQTNSTKAAQAGKVVQKFNAVESQIPVSARLGNVSGDGSEVTLEFLNEQNDVVFDVDIPAAQDVGEVIYPVITASRLTGARLKVGSDISISWLYDCLSNQSEGSMSYNATVAIAAMLAGDNGTTELNLGSEAMQVGVRPGTSGTFTIDGSLITTRGTVTIIITATADIEGEQKTATKRLTVEMEMLSLSSSYSPATGLATNSGVTGSITVPYNFSVPDGTTLRAWLNGELYQTSSISGSSTGRITIDLEDMVEGRNNLQLLAIDGTGLKSDIVSIDFRKAQGTASYLGLLLVCSSDDVDVSDLANTMPLPYAYSGEGFPLHVKQFDEIDIPLAAWSSSSVNNSVEVKLDNVTVQTITVGRTEQRLRQRFDSSGNHVLTVKLGSLVLTANVAVVATGTVNEAVTDQFKAELTAIGKSNSQEDRDQWGGITELSGLNYSANGWIDNTLLLTNGAKAIVDIKPFADYTDDNEGLLQTGMTLEIELKVSQIMERGAAIMHCLFLNGTGVPDPNDDSIYPRGIKITTEKASLLFGDPEEIHTTEKVMDAEGHYLRFSEASTTVGSDISSEGYYEKISDNVWRLTADTTAQSGKTYYVGESVSSKNAQDLYVIRPYGAEMNIAEDKWLHITFVVEPISNGYGLGLLYINGVLSRVNRYTNGITYAMRQLTAQPLIFDSDKADVAIRTIRYYRFALDRDQVLANWIATLHTGSEMQLAHDNNDVGGTDSNNLPTISKAKLLAASKGRGVLTFVKSVNNKTGSNNNGMEELFEDSVGKKDDFHADYICWDPPTDLNGNKIGDGFEARHVNIRIQGTSSVNYPYKNIRIYLAKTNFHTAEKPASISTGGKTYNYNPTTKKMVYDDGEGHTSNFKGYNLRGSGNSLPQNVLCAKTDFVDSSLVMNTGGAHLFNDVMKNLGLMTPPMEHDARVRQAIDGIPCDVYCAESEAGPFKYFGQFVLNNEKSKSGTIFGMEGVSGFEPTCPIALEALENRYALTLFQSAGQSRPDITIGNTITSFGGTTEENNALEDLLANTFGSAFEFNYPEDTFWTQAEINSQDKPADCHLASDLQKNAIRRLMSFIYHCVKESDVNMSNPEYGDANGWSAADKAKWYSAYFREHVSEYFDIDYLCTYYLFTEYWASVDQRAKNILWRTWDGLKWYPTYYDGDTAMSIRNDAFMVYLYSVTRDTYDTERSKFAFEGHDSWLWCLLLANIEYGNSETNNIYNRLAVCARNLRSRLTTQAMLQEFNEIMMGNWSERQYNYSQKLKYIDTMFNSTKYYPYTLTGNREAHRTQFLTDRAQLLDAKYTAGNYSGDRISLRVNRSANDAENTLTIKSADLYYFGYFLNTGGGTWLQLPIRTEQGGICTLSFTAAINGGSIQTYVCGASRMAELDLTEMCGNLLTTEMNLSACVMMTKLVIRNTRSVYGGILTLGNTAKLQYIDLTGQAGINNGTANTLGLELHTRLQTALLTGTGLTTLNLPEGAPITTLALPKTLRTLTLRNLPLLTSAGLTMEDDTWTAITGLNFAACPGLSWQTLLTTCANARNIRIEGIRGRVHSSILTPFMEGWNPATPNDYSGLTYHGLDADGTYNNWPQFGGSTVTLIDYVESVTISGTTYTFSQVQQFFRDKCGLTVIESPYSDYKENDAETDSENITNLDNLTGYDFNSEYVASGHILKIRDKSVPVKGEFNRQTEEMTLTKMSETNYKKFADGTDFDNTDEIGVGYDCFMYIPHFWYKGINDFKNHEKHTLLSSLKNMPAPTWTTKREYSLSEIVFSDTYGLSMEDIEVGDIFSAESHLVTLTSCATYRMDVENMKQVRYIGLNNANYGSIFVKANGEIIQKDALAIAGTANSPLDFKNDAGDYIFRDVPENAKYLYFTCIRGLSDADHPVFAVDSDDIEAIEPGWVEHKSELIGIYGASINDVDGKIHSLSGKVTKRGNGTSTTNPDWQYDANGEPLALPVSALNYTGQDFFNLCYLRGKGYHDVNYEQNKIIAILSRCWCGNRDDRAVYGNGISSGYTTGQLDSRGKRDTSKEQGATMNKIWGLEAWVSCNWEFMDHVGVNISDFATWKKNARPASGTVNAKWHIFDPHTNTERVVQGLTSGGSNCIARLKHGRHCDIIPSSTNSDTSVYSTNYAAGFWYTASGGRVVGRANGNANPNGGCVYAHASNDSSHSYAHSGARLAFSGKFANESEIDPDAEEEA
ncbi:MAG: hypothetical protein IKP36_05110 [Bacteroidaceae bacterium]|nr:hypothetical protein [Bacteroidaceae bacterium]